MLSLSVNSWNSLLHHSSYSYATLCLKGFFYANSGASIYFVHPPVIITLSVLISFWRNSLLSRLLSFAPHKNVMPAASDYMQTSQQSIKLPNNCLSIVGSALRSSNHLYFMQQNTDAYIRYANFLSHVCYRNYFRWFKLCTITFSCKTEWYPNFLTSNGLKKNTFWASFIYSGWRDHIIPNRSLFHS